MTFAAAAEALRARAHQVAEATTVSHFQAHPELLERYGARGREKCLQDTHYHLSYLAEAVTVGSSALFADYVAWAKIMLESRGVGWSDLARNLDFLKAGIQTHLPAEEAAVAVRFIDAGMVSLPQLPSDVEATTLGGLLGLYTEALLEGKRQAAGKLILDAAQQGTPIRDIYLDVFQKSQHHIGRLWQANRISVAQEHYCTAATQMIMSQLYPYIFATERTGRSLVATCVAGDLHEIGLRMVSDLFELEGWDTFYLGANAPHDSVVTTVADRRADCLAISATMTFHLTAVRELIATLRRRADLSHVKVLVGGYPFNVEPELWRQVGADGYGQDATHVVDVATRLVAS